MFALQANIFDVNFPYKNMNACSFFGGATVGRMILHSDCNAFYASVEVNEHPRLRGKMVAVGGDVEQRHGIILAKTYECKPYGVKTGMAIWQAKKACPGIIILPPHSSLYMQYSQEIRKLYGDYTDRVEPFGLDEAWLDVSGPKVDFAEGQRIAEQIRCRIRDEFGITVSIGVSDNKIYAKLGSDYKKPDAVTTITPENREEIVFPLPVDDLLYIGAATKAKLEHRGIFTIGRLAEMDPERLQHMLGKNGLMLSLFARGQDITPVAVTDTNPPMKSVGNSITTSHDLVDINDVRVTFYMLAESVAKRLRSHGFRCRGIQISVRDVDLEIYQTQCKLTRHTCLSRTIAETAIMLFERSYRWKKAVRSVGIRGTDLVYETQPYQTDMFQDEETERNHERLEREIDALRERFGYGIVQRGLLLTDRSIGDRNPNEHIRIGGVVQGRGVR